MRNQEEWTLPWRCASFSIGASIGNSVITGRKRIDNQKVVFQLKNGKTMYVYFAYHAPDYKLRKALLEKGVSERIDRIECHAVDVLPKYTFVHYNSIQKISELKKLFIEMAEALAIYHNLGYCHLNIKPEHFWRKTSGEMSLLGYDHVQMYQGTKQIEDNSWIDFFSAPELLEGKFSTASDIFSLGLTFYWILGGGFSADITQEAMYKSLIEGEVPRTNRMLRMCWWPLIRGMINSNPKLRMNLMDVVDFLKTERITFSGERIAAIPLNINRQKIYSKEQLVDCIILNPKIVSALRISPGINQFGITEQDLKYKDYNIWIKKLNVSMCFIYRNKELKTTKNLRIAIEKELPNISDELMQILRNPRLYYTIQIHQALSRDQQDILLNVGGNLENVLWVYYLLGGTQLFYKDKMCSILDVERILNNNRNDFLNSVAQSIGWKPWLQAHQINTSVVFDLNNPTINTLFFLAEVGSTKAFNELKKWYLNSNEYKYFKKISQNKIKELTKDDYQLKLLKYNSDKDEKLINLQSLLQMKRDIEKFMVLSSRNTNNNVNNNADINNTEEIERTKREIYSEALSLVKYANPHLLKTTIRQSNINWLSLVSLKGCLTSLKSIPKSQHIINETNFNASNIQKIFRTDFFVDLPQDLSGKKDPTRALNYLRNNQVYYVYNKQEISEWKKHFDTMIELQGERNKAIWKVIGWSAGIIIGIPIFVKVFPYLIVGAIVLTILAGL